MQQLASIEQSLSKLFKDLPHLPKGLTDWLADNAWWLVIIGVVLGVFGAFGALSALLLLGPVYAVFVGGLFDGGMLMLASLISIVALVATIAVEVMAIQPLKVKRKRGWDLIFLSSLISFAGSVLSSLILGNISSILWAVIGTAIGLYILFELRGHFVVAKAPAAAPKTV